MPDASSISSLFRHVPPTQRAERGAEPAQVELARGGDREATERLIAAHLPYVVRIAKEFRGGALPLEDVIAEGCVGLLKAIRHYRAKRGTRFMTYASFWVRKEMLAALSKQPHAVHVPKYARMHGFPAPRVLRLDVPERADDTMCLSERLPHHDPLPLQSIIDGGMVRRLRRHLLRLAPRDQAVLAWRFGLGGQPEQTLNEIARRLGLSRERVRQIEVSALARLRQVEGTTGRPLATRRPTACHPRVLSDTI